MQSSSYFVYQPDVFLCINKSDDGDYDDDDDNFTFGSPYSPSQGDPQCSYEDLMSNNFRRTAVLKKIYMNCKLMLHC